MRPDGTDEEFGRIWWANGLWEIPRQAAEAEDREWFEAHPGCNERYRELVPGEGETDSGGLCLPPEYYVVHVVKDAFVEYMGVDCFGPKPAPSTPAMFGAAEVVHDIDDLPESEYEPDDLDD